MRVHRSSSVSRHRIYATDADRKAAHGHRQRMSRNRDSVTLPNAPTGTAGGEAYTLPTVIAAARAALGRIDLDPASCAQAQTVVQATAWCGLDHPDPTRRDGLAAPWVGRLWINPPFSALLPWVEALIAAYHGGDVRAAIILLRGDVSAAYAQRLHPVSTASCWPSPRLRFWPHRVDAHGRPTSPNFPVILGYLGASPAPHAHAAPRTGRGAACACAGPDRATLPSSPLCACCWR